MQATSLSDIAVLVVDKAATTSRIDPSKWTNAKEKRRVYDCLHILENLNLCRRISAARSAGYQFQDLDEISRALQFWRVATDTDIMQHEKALLHAKQPILSTITRTFILLILKRENMTIDLSVATQTVHRNLPEATSIKSVERRLYDILSVLGAIGVLSRSKKQVWITQEALQTATCKANAHKAMRLQKSAKKRKRGRSSMPTPKKGAEQQQGSSTDRRKRKLQTPATARKALKKAREEGAHMRKCFRPTALHIRSAVENSRAKGTRQPFTPGGQAAMLTLLQLKSGGYCRDLQGKKKSPQVEGKENVGAKFPTLGILVAAAAEVPLK